MQEQDADELGRVHVRVWRETYSGHMPADFLAGLSPERSTVRFRQSARELYVVNVLAAHHGTGLGELLFTRAVGQVAGDEPVHLWVLVGNERARAFYRRHGFAPDGKTKRHEATGALEERWLRR